MPIYEFRCDDCMRFTMALLPISSKQKKTKCQFCGGDAERKISVTGGYKMKGYSAKNGYSKGDK
jgi:putative FmdB family regulatory protein